CSTNRLANGLPPFYAASRTVVKENRSRTGWQSAARGGALPACPRAIFLDDGSRDGPWAGGDKRTEKAGLTRTAQRVGSLARQVQGIRFGWRPNSHNWFSPRKWPSFRAGNGKLIHLDRSLATSPLTGEPSHADARPPPRSPAPRPPPRT